ncbi:MAG: DUF4260 domain-containing protein [Chloroflexi bacterium]|nr:DUF4260 domain-containing protein [Chloroflexota bacterium]
MIKLLNSPSWLLRLEGAVIFVIALVLYSRMESSWWLFVLLFLVPDVSMIGYAVNTKLGASLYKFIHAYVLPAALGLIGLWLADAVLVSLSVIWFAHIGLDRVLGFGLKYPTVFKDTHLQRV